ncbi:MAG: FAD-binding oxidoreductase, partial [Azoarcus sp.]|nr:FAD-binding oxidoreductase [Azoarcus sp.]
MDEFLNTLAAIVGRDYLLVDDAATAPYLSDWRGRYRGAARAVVLPADTAQVAGVIAACHAAAVPVVPQGGNTGLCGGATPLPDGRSVLLSLSRLNRIRELDTDNNTLCVEAGCKLA